MQGKLRAADVARLGTAVSMTRPCDHGSSA